LSKGYLAARRVASSRRGESRSTPGGTSRPPAEDGDRDYYPERGNLRPSREDAGLGSRGGRGYAGTCGQSGRRPRKISPSHSEMMAATSALYEGGVHGRAQECARRHSFRQRSIVGAATKEGCALGYRGPNVVFPENVHPEGSGDRRPERPIKTPKAPIWKRLIIGLSFSGTLVLSFWVQGHGPQIPGWLAISGTAIAIVLVMLIETLALRLPKGFFWRGWALPQPPVTTKPPDDGSPRPPASPGRP
jgi:hypothetical protein